MSHLARACTRARTAPPMNGLGGITPLTQVLYILGGIWLGLKVPPAGMWGLKGGRPTPLALRGGPA